MTRQGRRLLVGTTRTTGRTFGAHFRRSRTCRSYNGGSGGYSQANCTTRFRCGRRAYTANSSCSVSQTLFCLTDGYFSYAPSFFTRRTTFTGLCGLRSVWLRVRRSLSHTVSVQGTGSQASTTTTCLETHVTYFLTRSFGSNLTSYETFFTHIGRSTNGYWFFFGTGTDGHTANTGCRSTLFTYVARYRY